MYKFYLFILLWALSGAASTPVMAETVYRSDHQRATLLELYTSEGCSSCPPADHWYSGLAEHPGLWSKLIPVAFHVDYWDYLGWQDPFAQSKFSSRQRKHTRQGNISQMYTPGIMALGKEWRNWRRGQQPPRSPEISGVLELKTAENQFQAVFTPQGDRRESVSILTIALLGFGLETAVKKGENRGKKLTHDFVILDSQSFHSDDLNWGGKLPTSIGNHTPKRTAWAAWISPEGSLSPVQAVGGWR